MKSITSKVSKANKDNFIENLKQNLDPTLLSYVKIVQGDEKPYVDKFGRETNYYIMIDSKRIWLYQPGTVMFESGRPLGTGCASFLAKFIATLVIKYNKIKQEKERTAIFDGVPKDLQALNQEAYSIALTDTLKSLALRNVTNHDRLQDIKNML